MSEDRSLKGSVNAIDKVNDIRLSLNTDVGSTIVWVLVEGSDDCKIYQKFFDETRAIVEFVNGGKSQLQIALDTLTNETEQVIGIQDADFLHLEGVYPTVRNLFYTDCHDIEMTMLSFDNVVYNLFSEYCMQDKKDDIWQNILQESSYVAYVRWYNEKKNCKMFFSELRYGVGLTEISNNRLLLKCQDLLHALNIRSSNKTEELTSQNINNFITDNRTDDLLNLCNGHDVTALLSLTIGSQISHKEFCRHLRLSFSIQHFGQTKLYSDISDWQTKSGYAILRSVA